MTLSLLRFTEWRLLLAASLLVLPAAAGLKPVDLRTEYLVNPLAIEAPAPRLQWRLASNDRGQTQTAWRILVASSKQQLARNHGDLWDSGQVPGPAMTQIVYGGRPLASRADAWWKVMVWDRHGRPSPWSTPAHWRMGLLHPDDWSARWIAFHDPSPLHASTDLHLPPARHYRKEFRAGRPIRRATLYATALGLYEFEINGRRVGDAWFTPGWTDYRQRVYYQAWDVTPHVRHGPNALGAMVADGWYSGYLAYGLLVGYGPHKTGRDIYGKTPSLRAQLELEYADGSRDIIGTDPSWRVTDTGPLREADFLMGETYDARLELNGWSQPGFDDAAWSCAVPAEANGSLRAPFHDGAGPREQEFGFVPPPRLQAYPAPLVRCTETLRPVQITSPARDTYIFDLGQNFAGNVRLRVRGPAGQAVRLRYGEMLHPDGRLMTENLRKARATDTYRLRGLPRGETWTPRFTFHGFRFVEVTGFPGRPNLDTLTGLVLHSDTPLVGAFECSDPMVNQLYRNIVWTQRANFLELPTDCPQRDEREGWMGDAQLYVRTATFNADVAAFYHKWLYEVEEAQLPSGAYPDYCPWPFQHGKVFATAWTDAGIIVPWTVWRVYGDRALLERMWPSMTRFMHWRRSQARDDLGVENPDANTWGDWLNQDDPTPIPYIDTVYFAYTARLMADMADALERPTEARDYRDLFARIHTAFARKYLHPDGRLAVPSQTAHALALFTGLIPAPQQSALGAHLAELIRTNGFRMTTGFLGTRPLLPALSAAGQHDVAVRLLQSRRFPSWGFEVENGATTIWERWDSYTKEHGFGGKDGQQNASMNSFSHYSFGAVGEWMFATLAGIDLAAPGYEVIRFRPTPPSPASNPEHPPIDWVRARTASHRGTIASEWRRHQDRFHLRITVPPGCQGHVHLPTQSPDSVRVQGRPLHRAKNVSIIGQEPGRVILHIGAGAWRFQSELPPTAAPRNSF